MAGEYPTAVIRDGLQQFIARHRPDALPGLNGANELNVPRTTDGPDAFVTQTAMQIEERGRSASPKTGADYDYAALKNAVPARPSGFCQGCPARPISPALALRSEVSREGQERVRPCRDRCTPHHSKKKPS